MKLWNLGVEELEDRLVPGLLGLDIGDVDIDLEFDGDDNEFEYYNYEDNDTVIVEDSENVNVVNDSEVEDSYFVNDD